MLTDTFEIPHKKRIAGLFEFLPIMALCIDLFTPFLIWKNILPSAIRWGSHAAVALMILISLLRMLGFDHIPRSFWGIVAVCLIWLYIAIGNRQAISTTVWGIWLLFQFPFVGLFAYLQPVLPRNLPAYLRKFTLWILGLQLLVQLLQYMTGVRPGDSLSGLFGENGTGNAALFSIIVCCLYFGFWVESGLWRELVFVLVLGVISSVLGEMKLFPVAVSLIGALAAVLYVVRHNKPAKMIVFVFLIAVVLIGFVYLYNLIVPGTEEEPIQSYLTNPAILSRYLGRVDIHNTGGNIYADMGRDYAVQLGWNSLQKDPITFIFGYGIGSRSESKTLGTAGVALTSGNLGWSVGTSLLVFMQEMGMLGLVLLSTFILWINLSMVRDIRKNPTSPAVGIRFAIILFSSLWPVWLYYAVTWTMRVPMLLYWLSLGYVFAESRISIARQNS